MSEAESSVKLGRVPIYGLLTPEVAASSPASTPQSTVEIRSRPPCSQMFGFHTTPTRREGVMAASLALSPI